MTYTININGHDDLSSEEKKIFESELVIKARRLVDELKDESNVTSAVATTNTTGSVNLLED